MPSWINLALFNTNPSILFIPLSYLFIFWHFFSKEIVRLSIFVIVSFRWHHKQNKWHEWSTVHILIKINEKIRLTLEQIILNAYNLVMICLKRRNSSSSKHTHPIHHSLAFRSQISHCFETGNAFYTKHFILKKTSIDPSTNSRDTIAYLTWMTEKVVKRFASAFCRFKSAAILFVYMTSCCMTSHN